MEDIVIHQPARREHDVRIGNPEDVDEMMKIAMMATEENGLINPNPIKLLNDIWPALNRHQGVVGIIGSNYLAWKEFLKTDNDILVLFEDDITVSKNIKYFISIDF